MLLKRWLWFVFRSPQRKLLGWKTLITDLKGLSGLVLNVIFGKFRKKENIVICTGLYNRSEHFINIFLPSLNRCKHPERIALSVSDCGSSDVSDLETQIRNIWKGDLVFSSRSEKFTRTSAFNRAIRQRDAALYFICDADMELPANLVKLCNRYTSGSRAWFPVCRWTERDGSRRWFPEGTGMFAARKEVLDRIGLLDESITSWGAEDWELFFRMYRHGIMPLRTREAGLVHHWHEPTKPFDFIPVF